MNTNWNSGDNIGVGFSSSDADEFNNYDKFINNYAKKIVPGGSGGGIGVNANDINIDINTAWQPGQLVLLEGQGDLYNSHLIIKLVYRNNEIFTQGSNIGIWQVIGCSGNQSICDGTIYGDLGNPDESDVSFRVHEIQNYVPCICVGGERDGNECYGNNSCWSECGTPGESIQPNRISAENVTIDGEPIIRLYDIDVNIKSTMCILESIRNHVPTCKFIIRSTFIVIGKPVRLPVNEESECNPTTIYGANRLTSEHLCKIYHNVYGLDTLSFRITNSFGPREQYETPTKNALNYLIHQAFLGENVTIYNKGNFFRDIIYVDDVISALITILKFGKSGNLYWISSGEKTWFHEIGQWLNELTNTPIIYTEPPQYTKKVDVGNFVVDNSKLRSLGWAPKITVKDGIKKTLEYFKLGNN